MLLVDDGSCDQDDGQDDGFGVELEQAVEFFALCGFCMDAVGGKPVLIEPDVKQEHAKKPCEIEDIFFDGYWSAEGRGFDAQGCGFVWKYKKVLSEEEVQRCAYGKEQAYRPPETFLGDLYAFLRKKPECNDEDRNDK